MGSADWRSLRVLVTRPAAQAEGLCRLIEQRGGLAVAYPTLAVQGPADPQSARLRLVEIDRYAVVIFVSANAVTHAGRLIDTLPGDAVIAAVGKGTAAALSREFGRGPDLLPESYDSEGLLQLPVLTTVRGQRLLIVRGEGGRELLGDALRARGAMVEYAEVYRRICPQPNPTVDPLAAADVITVTSGEALFNLERLVGPDRLDRLHRMPLAVIHPSVAHKARAAGFSGPVVVAPEASDQGLIEALEEWATRQTSRNRTP